MKRMLNMSETDTLVRLKQVTKIYDSAVDKTPVLSALDGSVARGESLAVVGPSGCGKSTLLHLMGALDQPTSGEITFEGRELADLSEAEAAAFRNRSIGFVFQQHHLLPQCSVLENVLAPTVVHPDAGNARERAEALLIRVGLGERMHYRPGRISGGEAQRAAVVRALINRPKLLLADEPTGSLHPEGASALVDLLLELQREEGMALVLVTHAMDVAQRMDRVLSLRQGQLAEEG
jgi:lipoprotein-releasing system ATP-binding protein